MPPVWFYAFFQTLGKQVVTLVAFLILIFIAQVYILAATNVGVSEVNQLETWNLN